MRTQKTRTYEQNTTVYSPNVPSTASAYATDDMQTRRRGVRKNSGGPPRTWREGMGEDGHSSRQAQRKEGRSRAFIAPSARRKLYIAARASAPNLRSGGGALPASELGSLFPLLVYEQAERALGRHRSGLLRRAPLNTGPAVEDGVAARSTVFLAGLTQS